MSDTIERVLYYDRELLRGFDFTADQTYHIEMRRRLNLALHLRGIASGLELMPVADTGGLFCVNPGMAIDGYGREIVLFERYVLSDDDFLTARIKTGNTYGVYLSYSRVPATPPSAGYNACGLNGQYTRWVESPVIQLLEDAPILPDPAPSPTDPIPDHPPASPRPVFLGFVLVDVTGGVVSISKVTTGPGQREYVGVRAQRLEAVAAPPPGSPAPDPTVDIDATYPIQVEADLQAQHTVIVGDDFTVNKGDIVNAPKNDPNIPGTDGNLKVHNNIFVLGKLYSAVPKPGPAPVGGGLNVQWLDLNDYFTSRFPEIQFSTQKLNIPNDASPFALTATSTLPSVSKATIFVALAGIEWLNHPDFTTWLSTLGASTMTPSILVEGQFLNVSTTNPQLCNFQLTWTVNVKVGPVGFDPAYFVRSLTVNYIVVFYP
jgi:hypothetical protein